MTEKEIILNIFNRLNLLDKITVYEDSTIEYAGGWESLIIKFDKNGLVYYIE